MTPPVSPETPQERAERVQRAWSLGKVGPLAYELSTDVLSLSAEVEVLRGIARRVGDGWRIIRDARNDRPSWHKPGETFDIQALSPEESRVLSELTEEGM